MTQKDKKRDQKAGQKEKLGVVISSLFCEVLIFLVFFVLLPIFMPVNGFWKATSFLFGVVATPIFTLYLVYFQLAPTNLYWTIIQEGTSKIVKRGGKAVKGLIQYKGKVLNEDWDVVDGQEEKHLFGGLRFYGWWPREEIHIYKLRWTSIQENGKTVQHEEELDSILLKEKIYAMKIEGAEDKDGIPLDIDLLITLKVVNPYKAAFVGEDYLELVLNRTRPLFREYVRGFTFMELSAQKQRAGGELWKKLLVEKLIEEFKQDYGIQIKDGGIEMKNITPPKEYQKAQTQKRLAETEAERVAGETIGAVINMMAVSRGITVKKMQEKINNSTTLQKEFREYCKDTLHKKIAIDGGSYVKIDVSGAGGVEKPLLDLEAAWLKLLEILRGKREKEKPKKDKETKSALSELGFGEEEPEEE